MRRVTGLVVLLFLAACGDAPQRQADSATGSGSSAIHSATKVAIGPNAGEAGWLDSAYDRTKPGEMGPYLVWDAPTGGRVIAWWYNGIGLREVGDEPSAEELAAANVPGASTGSSGQTGQR